MAIIKNPTILVKTLSNFYKVLDENNTTLTAQDLAGVTEIGDDIQLGINSALESVILPDTVTYIGHNGIDGMTLQDVTITSSVLPEIEDDSFGPMDGIGIIIYIPDDADWGESEQVWTDLSIYDRIVEYSRE